MNLFRTPAWMILPVRVVLGLLAAFVLWQMLVFFAPRPPPPDPAMQKALEQLAREAVDAIARAAPPGRVGVAHIAGDREERVTTGLRSGFSAREGWSAVEGSPIRRFLADVEEAVAAASSLEEILVAGRKVGMDVIVAGRLLHLSSTQAVATARMDLYAYDVRDGKWLVKGPVEVVTTLGLMDQLKKFPLPLRVMIWIVVVGALPWLTAPLTRWALERKSNGASSTILIAYSLASLGLALVLTGFALAWGWAFVVFSLSAFYHFHACERIARREI